MQGNPPFADVLLEYVGRSVNLRQALEGCRLYPETSGAISGATLEYLRSSSSSPGRLLRAETS